MSNKFIADVHLGKLARWLRLLGFDTVYENDHTNKQLIQISKEQERVLLSRNSSVSKEQGIKYFIIADEKPFTQLKSVIDHFNLRNQLKPFSRCLLCNGALQPVSKENIIHLLENNTTQYFNDFWQCSNCKRIYWKGSHHKRMLKTIADVLS